MISKQPLIKLVLIGLLLMALTVLLALSIGSVSVPFNELISVLSFKSDSTLYNSIILYVRLPRVIVALLVGMNLAAAGVAVQAIFRNPMASPGIIGISSGASLGALLCIVFGWHLASLYYIPFWASLFALLSAFIVYRIASRGSGGHIIRLILVGIAISMLIRAGIQLILSAIDEQKIAQYVFWSMGSLADRRWEHVTLLLIPTLFCLLYLTYRSANLNMLLLGEAEAKTMGYDVERGKRAFLIASSVATAVSVSVSGMITFVGLIIPHIVRIAVGADNRKLMALSIISGGIFLVLCDLIARIIISPAEMSVGIITSLIGAPILLYLIEKKMRARHYD